MWDGTLRTRGNHHTRLVSLIQLDIPKLDRVPEYSMQVSGLCSVRGGALEPLLACSPLVKCFRQL